MCTSSPSCWGQKVTLQLFCHKEQPSLHVTRQKQQSRRPPAKLQESSHRNRRRVACLCSCACHMGSFAWRSLCHGLLPGPELPRHGSPAKGEQPGLSMRGPQGSGGFRTEDTVTAVGRGLLSPRTPQGDGVGAPPFLKHREAVPGPLTAPGRRAGRSPGLALSRELR